MNVWRARLGRWFGPVAARVPLSPNAISVLALALNLVGAWLFVRGRTTPSSFLLAIVFIAFGGLADALDGIVARVQNKATRFGDLLDHFLDRVSDITLAACWLVGNDVRESMTLGAVIAVLLNGYLGTQIEATYREREYESVGRGEFVLAIIVFPIVSYILATNGWRGTRAAGLTVPEWLTVLLVVFAVVGIVQRLRLAVRLGRS
jgi:phosphatidylglycerophosphate synthase